MRYNQRFSEEEKAWIRENSTLPGKDLHCEFCFKFGRNVTVSALTALRTRMGWPTSKNKGESGRSKLSKPEPLKRSTEYYQQFPPMVWGGGTYKIGKFGFLFRLDPHTGCFVKSNSDRGAYLRFLDKQADMTKRLLGKN